MSYMEKSIDDIRKALDEKTVTSNELFEESVALAKQYQPTYNAFVTILEEKKEHAASTVLSGIPYALKDNISTKGILTTSSSNILKNYVPIYNATVYQKLEDAGAVLVGKNVLDELAMGGNGVTGHTGVVKNPWDETRLMGGSSAGSAAAVALGIVPFAIASDTGDSIRKPASFGGIVGYKPTYGRVSRYGLFAFASSLDHVGCFTRNVQDAAYVIDTIKGPDPHDMTSLPDDNKKYVDTLDNDIKGRKLFYIKEACDMENYENSEDEELKETISQFFQTVEKIRSLGFVVDGISFPKELMNAIYPTYMAITCAEAISNNANLTGIPFGVRGKGNSINEIMFDARTKGFSELIKRRFVLGSYILQKENQEKLFHNARRVRRMIVDKMNALFEEYDGLIMPASGGIAPIFGEKTDQLSERYLLLENHMAIGNFGGFPSITLPSGFVNEMPIAINLTGRQFEDDVVLNMAYKIEKVTGYKDQIAKGGK